MKIRQQLPRSIKVDFAVPLRVDNGKVTRIDFLLNNKIVFMIRKLNLNIPFFMPDKRISHVELHKKKIELLNYTEPYGLIYKDEWEIC